MKVIGLIYENYNVFAHIVLSLLWFSFDYHMKKLYCVALRLWNTNTCGIHQIHWQVRKGMITMVLKAHKLILFDFGKSILGILCLQSRLYDD
jgi:hypothetical protein